MEKTKPISQMKPNDKIEGRFLLKAAAARKASNGATYLSAVLSDNRETIDLLMWDYAGSISEADAGKAVLVKGTANSYRGKLQIRAEEISLAPVPPAPVKKQNTAASASAHLPIDEMEAGEVVEGFYILQNATVKTASNGKAFLSGTLLDQSGTIPLKVWDYTGSISTADEGKAVKIRGSVSDYRGTLQITADEIRLAEPTDEIDVTQLVPVAPIDADEAYREIEDFVASLEDKDYQAVCRAMLVRHRDALRTIPAAKSVHHSFLHGLLMHTGYMLKTADFLAGLYSEVVNRDLLLTGTLLHDFAKAEEFTISEFGLVSDYSIKGQLLGHLTMGAQEIAEVAKELQIPEQKSILLQHMILSHHGKPEFGAAVFPLCAESELLSLIDMIDSRMEIYRENLKDVAAGEFSDRIFALDNRRVFRHMDTPDNYQEME